jgi:hypothetical protein
VAGAGAGEGRLSAGAPKMERRVASFDWHRADGEILEPPTEVVDYLEAVKHGDAVMLRGAIDRGAHVDTRHRVRSRKCLGGKCPCPDCPRRGGVRSWRGVRAVVAGWRTIQVAPSAPSTKP